MIPGEHDILVPRGGTLTLDFEDAIDPATGLPINFETTYNSARLIVRHSWMRKPGKTPQHPALLELSTDTVADIDELGGIKLAGEVIQIRYPYTLTELIKFSKAAYELELVIDKVSPAIDVVDKFMFGAFNITGELG